MASSAHIYITQIYNVQKVLFEESAFSIHANMYTLEESKISVSKDASSSV